eukprot:scaffold29265_cov101-Isochrysis_galbana.AAC.3
MRWVRVQDLVSRLAIQQDGRDRCAQVAVPAGGRGSALVCTATAWCLGRLEWSDAALQARGAGVGAGAEGGRACGHVARRRVGGGEALDQPVAQEGRGVGMPVKVVEHGVRLVLCVAHCGVTIQKGDEVGRVAEGEGGDVHGVPPAGDGHGRPLVEEVTDRAVHRKSKDGALVERRARLLRRREVELNPIRPRGGQRVGAGVVGVWGGRANPELLGRAGRVPDLARRLRAVGALQCRVGVAGPADAEELARVSLEARPPRVRVDDGHEAGRVDLHLEVARHVGACTHDPGAGAVSVRPLPVAGAVPADAADAGERAAGVHVVADGVRDAVGAGAPARV